MHEETKKAIDEAARAGLAQFRRALPHYPGADDDALFDVLRGTPTEKLAAVIPEAVPGAVIASRRHVLAVRGILSALIEEARHLDLPEDTAAVLHLAMNTIDDALKPERIGN